MDANEEAARRERRLRQAAEERTERLAAELAEVRHLLGQKTAAHRMLVNEASAHTAPAARDQRQNAGLTSTKEACALALAAIEEGQPFEHLDNVVAPVLRAALQAKT